MTKNTFPIQDRVPPMDVELLLKGAEIIKVQKSIRRKINNFCSNKDKMIKNPKELDKLIAVFLDCNNKLYELFKPEE